MAERLLAIHNFLELKIDFSQQKKMGGAMKSEEPVQRISEVATVAGTYREDVCSKVRA